MRFLDVKTDYAFKKVFGTKENKDILINFLNAVLTFRNNYKIKDLVIVDPYNIPMLKGMKDSYVDVKATLDNNSKVIIEMQVLNHKGFEKRVLYNMAKNYSTQLKKNEDYHLLNPVIALSIVDFIMFENSKKIISNFKLLEKDEFIKYSDDIELVFVELPKFKKQLNELKNVVDKWIYFIKNAGLLNTIPKEFTPQITRALKSVDEASFSEDELEIQHKRKEFIYIQKNSLELANEQGLESGMKKGLQKGLEKGLEQGLEKGLQKGLQKGLEKGLEKGLQKGLQKGLEQGKEQRNIQIAKNLLFMLDDESISTTTGLSIDKIKQLRK
jgi:predicted transposase/invertase (TIGR01784 family)